MTPLFVLYLFQVASALHDNCRAVLVGKRTYGKVHNFSLPRKMV